MIKSGNAKEKGKAMYGENTKWMGEGWYRINRPLGKEQLGADWIEFEEDFDGLIEWAKNDLQGTFEESLSWVEYLGDGEEPEE